MSLLVIGSDDGAVVVDKTTGRPLPMEMFESTEHAEHFVDWVGSAHALLGAGDHYDAVTIEATVALWREQCLDADGYILEAAS